MQKCLISLSIVLACLITGFSQSSTQNLITPEGSQIEFVLKPDKKNIILREPTFINLQIKAPENLCPTNPDFAKNFANALGYEVIVSKNGEIVETLNNLRSSSSFTPCQNNISSKDYSLSISFFLDSEKIFRETGNYSVTLKRKVPANRNFSNVGNSLTMEVVAQIKVIPYEDKIFEEIINTNGKKMLQSIDTYSFWLLSLINDRRTINYFSQYLEKLTQYEIEGEDKDFLSFFRANTIYSLRNYDDDKALKSIESLMSSSSDKVRSAVAWALLGSPHPKALNLLLQMRSDKFENVRFLVVLGLEKIDTDESTVILSEMLKDENQKVREKVAEILNNRKSK